MNNEFNSGDTNQVPNNNMNNGYVSNYNNFNNNKNDNWKNVLIVIMFVIILFLTALTIYVVVYRKDNDVDNKDNNIQENGNNDANLSDSEMAKYLEYVPYLESTLVEESYDDAYSGKNVNIDQINKNILLYSAITNTERYDFKHGDSIPKLENGFDAISYYNVIDINDYLNKVYNIDNSNMPNKIKISGGTVVLKDNYYLPVMGAGSTPYDKYVYSTKHYLENNNLVIEENVLFYIYNIGDSKCNVYANTSDMHNETNVIDIFDLDYTLANNISLKDYTDKTPTKYKHTYKKVNNEYVWYSTEIVK